jgi:hypothetical protein
VSNVRIMVTADQADRVIARFKEGFNVLEVSDPYPNRRGESQLVRVYLTVDFDSDATTTIHAEAVRTDRHPIDHTRRRSITDRKT